MKQHKIEAAYATFDFAKFLKEKGFDESTNYWYSSNGERYCDDDFKNNRGSIPQELCSAPEQWQVVEWLRVEHGIWIDVKPDCYGQFWYAQLSICSKERWEDVDNRSLILSAHTKFNNEHKSPQEAVSAAFDYIKDNKLI